MVLVVVSVVVLFGGSVVSTVPAAALGGLIV
ncbi:hypothetical protein, partial [Mycolicibacterium austroafricanum]